ncbi:TonB-dependent receptor [Lentisalinibacter sediminis]|uniref:TonB-dependent receptor n=1 Tax=Lentisalinibacter sediminis TaxID=2992237 RepID=UPI00386FBD19
MKPRILFASCASACLLLTTQPVIAQEAGMLEEIIVTAQKREQSLQEVPISVTAIGEQAIQEGKITGVQDVALETPNFTMTQFNIGEPQYYIRGIGNSLDSAGSDPAVATFIDEVYIGRSAGTAMDLYDLDRVEVLRGPQGTLFGKNVVGGALNIITKKPSPEFEAKFGATVGNYSQTVLRGFVNGAIADNVSGKLSVSRRQRDGYVDNVVDGEEYHDEDNFSARGQLLFTVSDATEVLVGFDWTTDDQAGNCRNVNNLDKNDPLGLAVFYPPVIAATTGGDVRKCASEADAFQERDMLGTLLRVDHDFANSTLTSITAYRETDYAWLEDLAGMPLGDTPFNLTDTVDEEADQISQELRLASTGGETFDWLVGAFYMTEDVDRKERYIGSFHAPLAAQGFALLNGDVQFNQINETTSTALFGKIDWYISERLTWSIGARYARDEKEIEQAVENFEDPAFDSAFLSQLLGVPVNLVVLGIPVNGPTELLTFVNTGNPGVLNTPYNTTADESWSEFVPSTNVSYQFNDDGFVYFTAARGYKSGAFVSQTATPQAAATPLDPEIATNYELGVKSEFLNNRLRVNAAVFRMDYEDLQVFRLDGSLLIAANAEATSQGLELDTTALLTDNWVVNFNYGYLDAEYDQFISGGEDFTGNRLPRAPENSFSVTSNYTFNLAGGSSMDFNLNYAYQDDFFHDPSNANGSGEDGYGLLRAGFTWTSASGAWDVTAWGKNLTDEEYRTHTIISNIAGTVDLWGMPRTYGLTVNYRMQ